MSDRLGIRPSRCSCCGWFLHFTCVELFLFFFFFSLFFFPIPPSIFPCSFPFPSQASVPHPQHRCPPLIDARVYGAGTLPNQRGLMGRAWILKSYPLNRPLQAAILVQSSPVSPVPWCIFIPSRTSHPQSTAMQSCAVQSCDGTVRLTVPYTVRRGAR